MPIDLDDYRAQSRATWGEVAGGWEARREWLMAITGHVSAWLVEKAAPERGQTFLEIAAGPGDLGFAVAERVGDGGRVISSDFSREMIEVARRNGESRRLTNVDYRMLDAESMDLDDRSVDGVVCRWGYMLVADPAAALKETRRVLRDGGRLAFAVWMAPERNPWAALPTMTIVERGHLPPPEPGAPGMFALGDPARIRQLVTQAGFAELELEEIAFEFHYSDFDDLWDTLVRMTGPVARAINALPEDERKATRAAISARVAPYRNSDGSYTPPAATWAALAR
jgi:ubiquinone/menaquinone biosynthesis C-methylase UbiE